MIPFLDLKTEYKSIESDVNLAIKEVIDNTSFINGPYKKKFEENFANYLGVKNCIGCANGTLAIFIALKALGVKDGDEVITVPNTFIATTEMISAVGAKIVFTEIDKRTYMMDPSKLEEKITSKTKVILPVHLYGMPCDMSPILDIARKHGIKVVSDAAQAHGAEYNGTKIGSGSLSDITTFSFFPGKNLGAYGDAGAVVTDDNELAIKMRMLIDHGRTKKYEHDIEAYNMRIDDIQSAILDVKLKRLDEWNERRRRIAEKYNKAFEKVNGIITQYVPNYALPVYHLYVIQTDKRDFLMEELKKRGISTGIHYPISLPDQPAYRYMNVKGFQYERDLSKRILSLPIYPQMKDEDADFVIDSVLELIN